MGKSYFYVDDQATVELLQALKEGKKPQSELVKRLRGDYRRLRKAINILDKIEIDIRISIGYYKPIKIPIKVLKKTFGTHNGRTKTFLEINSELEIINLDYEKGEAKIAIDEEVFNHHG